MVWALWTLIVLYAVSLGLLVVGGIVSRRSRPFRRFLIGEPEEDEALRGRSG